MLRRFFNLLRGKQGNHGGTCESSAEDFESILDKRPEVDALPVLPLSDYRVILGEFEPPTDEQISSFAVFVANAKSWYKHLPLMPPGAHFQFFIDPHAGLDRILLADGKVALLRRTEDTVKFHYSWVTTDDYRANFGLLSFSCEAGSELFLPVTVEQRGITPTRVQGMLDNNWSRAIIYRTNDRPHRLPPEVLETGSVRVTGVIHERAATAWVWQRILPSVEESGWPSESGGEETWAMVKGRRLTLLQSRSGLTEPDPELVALLAPERSRIRGEMIAAMQRVRDLIYE